MSAQLSFADTIPPLKTCGHCCASYDAESWKRLELAPGNATGRMTDGAGGELELRNCPCGQTLAIEVPSDWSRPAAARAPGVFLIDGVCVGVRVPPGRAAAIELGAVALHLSLELLSGRAHHVGASFFVLPMRKNLFEHAQVVAPERIRAFAGFISRYAQYVERLS